MRKITRKSKEIIAIVILLCTLILSILIEASIFQPPLFMICKNNDVFMELFEVQATISTLSIAIVREFNLSNGTLEKNIKRANARLAEYKGEDLTKLFLNANKHRKRY